MTRRTTAPKTPPYAITSEKLLLGAMLRQPPIATTVKGIVSGADDFFRPEYARLYEAIIAAEAEDPDTLRAALGPTERFGGEDQLDALIADAPDAESALDHARVVAEKARLRGLLAAMTAIMHEVYYSDKTCAEIVAEALERLDTIRSAPTEVTRRVIDGQAR